jgi:Ca-activated chloride channel family protein
MTVRTLAAILICTLLVSAHRASVDDESKLQRDFSENLTTIVVENPDGPTEVQTWDRREVRAVASASHIDTTRLTSQVLFERTAPNVVRIRVRREVPGVPIALTLYVPSSIHLSLRTANGNVTVSGEVAGLSVETESGAITLNLPAGANSDLSLRTIEGSIETKLATTPFGRPDRHAMDARVGRGGSTVIARSVRGNITLRPATFSRSLPPDKRPDTVGATDSIATGARPSRASEQGSEIVPSTVGDGASESGEMLKLEARLVNLNVKVTDATGKTLPSLRKEDFVVYEDGVSQELFYFEQVSAPLNIVLLLDLSGSTSHKMKIMKKAAQKFVDSFKPDDNIAVAAFTRRFFIISNFTTNHKQLKDRIDDIKNRHSGTAYYDAMWATLNLLDEPRGTRKAVVVLTDGVDNSLDHPDDSDYTPKHGFDELLARVEEADATIYPIYFDTEYETIGRHGRSGHDAYATARKQLEMLAEQTGATLFKAERAEDLEGVYKQVAAELHSLYSLAYTPKTMRKDGQWRRIGVSLNLPDARVRTKRGYFAK